MRFTKTPGELVAEIRMERASGFRGALMVVEALDDKKLWLPFVIPDACRILLSYGKSCSIAALQLVGRLGGEQGTLAVVDDDYDTLLGRRLNDEALIYLDARDVEALLIRSSALERVVMEFADEERVRRAEAEMGASVREVLVDRTLPLGRLRLAAQREAWSVSFADLTMFAICDHQTALPDIGRVLDFVKRQCRTLDEGYIEQALNKDIEYDPWMVCHGSDLMGLLCVVMRGPLQVTNIGPQSLFSSLRLAFTFEDLENTATLREVRAWEERHSLQVLH